MVFLPVKMEPAPEPVPVHRKTTQVLAQFSLTFEDARLQGMTPVGRQTAVRTLASLLLEATGDAPSGEIGDDSP